MKNLVIVNAGLGVPSTTQQVAQRIADATLRQTTATGEGLEIRRIDLRTLATDLATYMTTFLPTPALSEAQRTVTGADALIAATPVFQGSYAGLFKMFFDTLEMHSLDGVPVTMVATAGTPRHSMVLDYAVRPLLSFLHAVVLPTGVFADTAEFGEDSDLPRRIDRAAGELTLQLVSPREDTTASGIAGDATGTGLHVPAGGFAALLAGHSGV